MAKQHVGSKSAWILRAALIGAAVGAAGSAAFGADTILEIYGPSLTQYLGTATPVQGVVPRFDQRGVGVDGRLRAPSPFGWAIAGNPLGDAPAPADSLGDLQLATGMYAPTVVDLSMPAQGPAWVIGRTYNTRQVGGSNDGYQGKNWFQTSQPELVLHEDGEDNADDVLYLVYGADRYIEFKRTATDATTFKSKNGAAGLIRFEEGVEDEPDTYVYFDQVGRRVYFFGDNTASGRADWQLWKIVDAQGAAAFIGDEDTASTAVSGGFNADGTIAVAYDMSGGTGSHRYTYTYSTIDSVSRLTQVKADAMTGAAWSSPGSVTEVGRVNYAYYQTGNNTYGDNGNLQMVTITTPLTEASTVSLVQKTHYRYWKGAHSGGNPGFSNAIQYVVNAEGARRHDWDDDSTLNDSFLTASENDLKPYAAAYFEYESDTNRLVNLAWFNGDCGCGGADGTHRFLYEEHADYSTNILDSTYQSDWGTRVVIQTPEYLNSAYVHATHYFDEVGQPLSRVVTDDDPAGAYSKIWATELVRNSSGQIVSIHSPANNDAYTHNDGFSDPDGSFTRFSGAGVVSVFDRVSSGDMTGFLESVKHKLGDSGTAYFDSYSAFTSTSMLVATSPDHRVVRPMTSASRLYHTEGSSAGTSANYDETTSSYSVWDSTDSVDNVERLAIQGAVTTDPAVSATKNGSGSANTSSRFYRKDGTPNYGVTREGLVSYTGYEGGLPATHILDPDDGTGGGLGGLGVLDDPGDYAGLSLPTSGWTITSTTEFDPQGRPSVSTAPDGLVSYRYYSKLADGRAVTIAIPRRTGSGTYTYFGPAQFTVTNLAGEPEMTGSIALAGAGASTALNLWIDESDDDPVTALGLGTLARMRTFLYDDTGTSLAEVRAYFDLPASGAGADGTNYDATLYEYDELGRRRRTEDPTGTITITTRDELGRVTATSMGTDDSGGSSNMSTVSETEYDGGADGGNSLVTTTTQHFDSGTSHDTQFLHDYRGRAIVTLNPVAPHMVTKFDNRGRAIATGYYSSTSGLDATDDPTTLATNRVGLNQRFLDESGREWKSQIHKIDTADGSDDDTLETLTWYTPDGRIAKVDGEQLTKTAFDQIGRPIRTYILAKDDDATNDYDDAMDVVGDHVMHESIRVYESDSSNRVMYEAGISRHHDDLTAGTTGGLDSNADGNDQTLTAGNVNGRVQITAMWYDALGRLTDTVLYGTNGIVGDGSTGTNSFSMPGSAPSSTATTPRTTNTYNDDGSLQQVADPLGGVMRYVYDDQGRRTAVIANYINGVPSGVTGDDDVITRTEFTDGLRTKVWVDFDGDGVEDADDQVTTYTFGTTKGASAGDSEIATGHLLQQTSYPDSTGGSDVVSFAYNLQGRPIYRRDPAGNVVEITYDGGGRETERAATTLASGFDGAVRLITQTYNSRGNVELVTQYDAVTSGGVVNQIKQTYSDWPGMLKSLRQDKDSTVGGGGANDYEVEYTLEKNTTGRNTIRRTFQKVFYAGNLEQSTVYTYGYSASHLDDELSRVNRVRVGGVTVAHYFYTGVSGLVGTEYPEIDVYSNLYGSSTGDYPNLDRFNRVVTSAWTKDLATDRDIYDVDYVYDEYSNLTRQVDNIHTASGNRRFDAEYTHDGLYRLTEAVEGHWGGSSISPQTRQQAWTLTQSNNWDLNRWDHNGDNDYVDADELDDRGTFDEANQWTARDIDDDSSDDYTLTCNANNQLTDDGDSYEYEYDAFGRLRKLKKTTDQSLVAEYTYNGLGRRVGWHYDVDGDGTVENTSDDPWFYFAYDEDWRVVAVFRGSDAEPKELFVNHMAGLDGYGTVSGLDGVILRDKDNTNGWVGTPDGSREERVYYAQTAGKRHDVVALISSTGAQAGQVRYSSYGVPYGIPAGDLDADGDVDGTDSSIISTIILVSGYRAIADLDLDGDVDFDDGTIVSGLSGTTLGRGALSLDPNSSTAAGSGNRRGYAAYEHDGSVPVLGHVRHRVLHTALGRWIQPDPLEYSDSMNLYSYVRSAPLDLIDPLGLESCSGGGSQIPGVDPSFLCCVKTCVQGGGGMDACQYRCRRRDPGIPGGLPGFGIPGPGDGPGSDPQPPHVPPTGTAVWTATLRCYFLNNGGYKHCYVGWHREGMNPNLRETYSMGPLVQDAPLGGPRWNGYYGYLDNNDHVGLRPSNKYQTTFGESRRNFEPHPAFSGEFIHDSYSEAGLHVRLRNAAQRNYFYDRSFDPRNCGSNWLAARMWSVATQIAEPPPPTFLAIGWDQCGPPAGNQEFVFVP